MMQRTRRWIRLTVALTCVSIGVVLLAVPSTDARSAHQGGGRHFIPVRHRVIVGIGPWWWGPYPWGPYPYWWYYPPPYYPYPPTVVVEEPPVYIEQQPAAPTSPPAEQYWYYCRSAGAYYPSVPTCAEEWIKVPPRAE